LAVSKVFSVWGFALVRASSPSTSIFSAPSADSSLPRFKSASSSSILLGEVDLSVADYWRRILRSITGTT
jgi:hypothetical protein